VGFLLVFVASYQAVNTLAGQSETVSNGTTSHNQASSVACGAGPLTAADTDNTVAVGDHTDVDTFSVRHTTTDRSVGLTVPTGDNTVVDFGERTMELTMSVVGDSTAVDAARYTTADRSAALSVHQEEVQEIRQDLCSLAETELSVIKQADGTLVIQSNPAPRPRPQLVHRPQEICRVNLVPSHPSPKQIVPRTSGKADIVLDAGITVDDEDDDDDAQYVDIVVEDCEDDFEEEECVV